MATIGIAEPDPGIRNLMKLVLVEEGHCAVELQLAQPQGRVDLLIVEVTDHTPQNLLQLADSLRRGYPGVPVLFCTSYADLARLAQEQFLFEEILLKPFSLDELLAKVNHLLSATRRMALG